MSPINDNNACVLWSKSKTTKGLRHIQMRENAVRELTLSDFLLVTHILGERNLADLFTKEDKDVHHYQQIRNAIMAYPPVHNCVHTARRITAFFDALCSTPETAHVTKGGVRYTYHLNGWHLDQTVNGTPSVPNQPSD